MTQPERHLDPSLSISTEHRSVFLSLVHWLGPVVATGLLAVLASGSFHERVAYQIKSRDQWRCTKCHDDWRPYLHASHFNHSRNHPEYQKTTGGETLCIACHYDYHFDHHVACLARLGLTTSQNLYALEALWDKMLQPDRQQRLKANRHFSQLTSHRQKTG